MNTTITWLLGILALVIFISIISQKTLETFQSRIPMTGRTKCFSCEADLLARGKSPYQGRPTKCFACENDLERRGLSGRYGQPTKCVGCGHFYE